VAASSEFWINLAARYEVLMVEREAAKNMAKITTFARRAA